MDREAKKVSFQVVFDRSTNGPFESLSTRLYDREYLEVMPLLSTVRVSRPTPFAIEDDARLCPYVLHRRSRGTPNDARFCSTCGVGRDSERQSGWPRCIFDQTPCTARFTSERRACGTGRNVTMKRIWSLPKVPGAFVIGMPMSGNSIVCVCVRACKQACAGAGVGA